MVDGETGQYVTPLATAIPKFGNRLTKMGFPYVYDAAPRVGLRV
jgi:hypothetical protein